MTARPFALAPAEQAVRVAEARAYRLSLVPRAPNAAERLARRQQLEAAGLDAWQADHLAQLEEDKGTLLPLRVLPDDVVVRVREPSPDYGPPATPPTAPPAFRWASVPGVAEQVTGGRTAIGDPLTRRSR